MLTLLPFSREELARADAAPENWFDHTFTGGYPRIFDAGLEPTNFYRDYVDTYLERDVRQLSAVRDTSRFQTLLQLCAANVGQILNLNQLAKDCGISQTAAGDWLNLMEASYVLFRLKPWFSNIRKRLVKRPKLYFHDTGVACYLLGLTSPEHVERQPLRGALFENAVVNEIMKFDLNRNRPAELFFFRDSNGNEVDLLYRRGRLHGRQCQKVRQWTIGYSVPSIALFSRLSSLIDGEAENGVSQGIDSGCAIDASMSWMPATGRT